VLVVLLEERFLLLEERAVGFFEVDLTVVPLVFETVLLTVFAGVLLAVFADVLLAGRDVDALDLEAELWLAVPVEAIARACFNATALRRLSSLTAGRPCARR
jgi:hypothetical protein